MEAELEAGPAGNYQKGLKYMSVGRRLHVAARLLDEADAAPVRKQADILAAKGLALLRAAVRPNTQVEN